MYPSFSCFSIVRRMTKSRCSSAPLTNSWRILGRTLRATGPTASGTTGTSRHEMTFAPFSRTAASKVGSSPTAPKTMATPYSPFGGRAGTVLRKKASGICRRRPAPSPVSGSFPVAPRCMSRFRTVRPRVTMSWEATLSRFATRPTPQASCSKFRSYIPICPFWCIMNLLRTQISKLRAKQKRRRKGLNIVQCLK